MVDYYYPLISVCISTWNRVDKLTECLISVSKQSYPNIEIIIVDNASMDGTREVIKEYSYVRDINYIVMPNSKFTAMQTINTAFKQANGKYILILDDDASMPDPDCILKLYETMQLNPNAAIVGANVDDYKMPIRNEDGAFLTHEEVDNIGIIKYFEFHGCCALFHRARVSIYDYYDPDFNIYMNEMDLSLKCIADGWDVIFNSYIKVHHAGAGNVAICKNGYNFLRNYSTVLTRNFRGFKRFKVVILHNFMTVGYHIEHITLHRSCGSPLKVLPYLIKVTPVVLRNIYRSIIPDKKITHINQDYLDIIEDSLYNGFKMSIKDRFTWFAFKKGVNSGAR